MAGYVLTWNSVDSDQFPGLIVTKVFRNMVGSIRDERIAIPGLDGDYIFTERRGNREIRAVCKLVSAITEKRADVSEIADWLDQTGYRQLIVSDQADRYWDASLQTDPNPDEWKRVSNFELIWTAKPYAQGLSLSEECASATEGQEISFNVTDKVDAYPVIEMTALGGDMDGFTITVNDEQLTYAGDLLEDETITISSLSNTIQAGPNTDTMLTGALSPGYYFPNDINGIFPVLVEGTNTWQVDWVGTATSVQVCIYWRRRYR